MNKAEWYLYLIRCRDGSIYTGISTDVKRRFVQHQKQGSDGSKYLKGRGPLVLVFQMKVGNYSLASKVESKIKKMPKDKKEKILREPEFLDEIVHKIDADKRVVRLICTPHLPNL
jgi:putative endonuclease